MPVGNTPRNKRSQSPKHSTGSQLNASWLCCLLEDCPTHHHRQSVELTCVASDAPKEPEYVELVPLTHLVAYQRKTTTGEILCCYGE